MKVIRLLDRLFHLLHSKRDSQSTPKGVLILSCGGLGDTILFSHVLPRFSELAEPDELITVLMRKDGAKTSFLFDDHIEKLVIDFNKFHKSLNYRWQMLKQINKSGYRVAITTDFVRHPDLDEALLLAANAPECVAMKARSWPKYDKLLCINEQHFTRLFESGEKLQDKVIRWSNFANWLSGSNSPPPVVRQPNINSAKNPFEHLVLIQPFSAVKAKQCSPALYQNLIEVLPDNTKVRITGTPSDLENNPEFKPLLEMKNVEFDTSTFEQLVPLMQRSSLVISVDTAVMHLAVTLGTQTLCLASAAYVGEITPYAPEISPNNAHFLYQPMECQGCLGDCSKPLQENQYACIAALDEKTVLEKVETLLNV